MRSIFTFVLVVVVTALLWVIIGGQPAHAADGNWSGESIIYDGHGFTKATDFKDPTGTIPAGSSVYKTVPQTGTGSGSRVFIIYFSPGVDPPTATTAKYVEFDTTSSGTISNPQNARDITLTVKGEESEYSSCSVGGIGWIICPISVFFAEAMDNVFTILASMIAVQPSVLGDPNNSLYVAWNVMRNIANLAFVIVFLIIIYAQLTNVAVSNYGIKKLIPRLIVAAILVNMSFIITALAIDISNVLGYSIQDVFNTIREDTFNITNDNFEGVNNSPWTAVTGVILAGGGYIGVTYFLTQSGLYFLVPLLLGLVFVLVIVVIVLAARQAIIVILVIIAPLAFVANLLPNTEKWFDKWRDLFMTMLIFFPAFSLVFGGSQLAGSIIIQNAGDNIVVVLFGMAVQIAPLVITPLLFKLSGNLLGKIAQIANNPSKGLLDRNKKWAESKGAMHREKKVGDKLAWWNTGGKTMQMFDNGARKTKDRTELYKMRADNKYHKRDDYRAIHDQMEDVQREKRIVEADLEIHSIKNTRGNAIKLEQEMTARVRADQVTDLKGRLDNTYEDLKSNKGNFAAQYGASFGALEAEAVDTTRTVALNAMRQQSAKRAQAQNLYQDLKDNTLSVEGQVLRSYAGGVQGHIGAQRALAQAISEQHRAHGEVITNANAILDDYNLDAAQNLSIAKNITIPGVDISITEDIQEAAIKRVASNGVIPHIEELLKSVDFSPGGNENYRTALVEALKGNSSRPKYIGYGVMDQLGQGIPGGINDGVLDDWIEGMLRDDKLSAKELAVQDKDTLQRVYTALPRLNAKTRSAADQVLYNNAITNLKKQIDALGKDKDLTNAAGERQKIIDRIDGII